MQLREMKQAMFHNKFIALDTESTGFQPEKNFSKLIEIGAVKVEDGKIVDRFDELINPGINIPKKIRELTHITNEDVAGKDDYISVLTRFYKWCEGDYVLVMHNAPHDLKFLNFFGKEAGITFDMPYIDTQKVAKDILHGEVWSRINYRLKENYKLTTLAQLFKIPDNSHHRANNDAEVTWLVCRNLRSQLTKKEPETLFWPKYEYKKTKTEEDSPIIDEATMLYISPWQKASMKRLYVRLSTADDSFADIYYDFVYNCWNIKTSMFPIKSFGHIEEKIKNKYRTSEMKFENFNEKVYVNEKVTVS